MSFQPVEYFKNLLLRAALGAPKLLPYKQRINTVGWITGRILAPLAGYNTRVKNNISYIYPDMDEQDLNRLAYEVPRNAGRTLAEIYSGTAFIDHVKDTPLTGEGLAALDEAHANNRPIIIVTPHFGNYDALRTVIRLRGHKLGGLYRPMSNPYFNAHYERKIKAIAAPIFANTKRGMAGMIKHIRGGNTFLILPDQMVRSGPLLRFMGKPSYTTLSAAEMALKYDALLIPIFAPRINNGLDFEVIAHKPIEHSTAELMSQQINDVMTDEIDKNLEQWLWVHDRWKNTPTEFPENP